jgi:hypothetical protein
MSQYMIKHIDDQTYTDTDVMNVSQRVQMSQYDRWISWAETKMTPEHIPHYTRTNQLFRCPRAGRGSRCILP